MRSPADLFPVRLANRRHLNPTTLQWILGLAVVGTVGYFVFKPKEAEAKKKPPTPKTYYFFINSVGIATRAELIAEQIVPTEPLLPRLQVRAGDHVVWGVAPGLKDPTPRGAGTLTLVTPTIKADRIDFDFEILPVAKGQTFDLGVNYKQFEVDKKVSLHAAVSVTVI